MRTKKDLLSQINEEVIFSKFIAPNTLKIEYKNGNKAIRLHDTDIITFAGKDIILNSGGWRTRTTKERINDNSPACIVQFNGVWYLSSNKRVYPQNSKECTPFYDGCVIDAAGNLKSKPIKVNENKINDMKKRITKYVNLINKDNLPYPNSGDCWDCSFRTKEGETMGEISGSDHLLSHLKEGYLHGSILVNAMREAGYQDQQIGVHYQLKIVDTFKRALRRYLQKRLISNIAVK